MPGSCDSEPSSSPSLISSLRKFRFQNKAKTSQPADTPNQSSSSNNGGPTSSKSADHPSSQKSSPSTTYNPLSYRKYENPNAVLNHLRNISEKIQTAFKKSSNANPILDLILTHEETKLLKDTVLEQPSVSVKWSFNVTEHPASDSNQKLLKIKRLYLFELSKYISEKLNSKQSKYFSSQARSENQPKRTYSRSKSSEITENQSICNNSSSAEGHTQGAMDDYEEFCEKEQCLRKMLDAFPGADIMEAQDILVKCQWDLNKAMIEARNQPLRTTRKRGFPGNPMPQTAGAPNLNNQKSLNNAPQTSDHQKSILEEIVLDSSDEEEMNGSVSLPSNIPDKNNGLPNPIIPPAKRVRRLISTDSSEDEAALAKSPVNTSLQKSQITVPPVTQKLSSSVPTATNRTLPSTVQNSSSDKPVSVNQSLSIKPVPVSTPTSTSSPATSNEKPATSSEKPAASSEKTAASSMPKLPKGLVLTQVGSTDNSSSKSEKEGVSVNGNHVTNIPVPNKSAHLVRIKPSNNVSVSSNADQTSTVSTTSNVNANTTNKTANFSVGKGVSITPLQVTPSQNTNVPKTTTAKALSITPVSNVISKDSLPKEKSPVTSAEESSLDSSKLNHQRTKNDSKNDETNDSESDIKIEKERQITDANVKKKKKRNKTSKKAPLTKRKKFESDDDDDDDYGNEDIYDSEDSDCGENLTAAHSAVLKFFQEASPDELGTIPGCSKKKIEAVINHRPFTKWLDLVEKLRNDRSLSTDLLNGAKKVLDMRNAITKLMNKCQRISLDMEDLVENLKEEKESSSGYVSKQPDLLNERMHLTGYQMLGLNWLLLMHNQQVNAILADEMGLGKTVQAISFLAYLKQIEEEGPHLIVVPSSTLDNWRKELETWWPTVSVICYHGGQEARRELRLQILNDEIEEFDVMITTYNMVCSSAEDRNFFKRLEFNYVVFDEAHMLKNMSSQRYTNLMRIKAPRRLLLTGTPLQNNLVELMSLLIFAMPHMFSGKIESIKQMFSCVSKASGNKNTYEKDRIEHAKRIMKPFVLRRLKRDVLKELPNKQDETKYCPMVEDQANKYEELITKFSAEVQTESSEEKDSSSSGAGMMMQLRRAANHPLLLRRFFDDEKLLTMSKLMIKEPTHVMSDPNIIFEDMAVMSDFELHRLCKQYKTLKSFILPPSAILNSGKFKALDELLPDLIKEDHRILLFSQFTMVLDIVEEYMNIRKYKFLRLDGQVPVPERQQLIDDFNNDPEILVFLLSTRAGGLGINLTAADTVILHDIDFNPYNDKQAEDRCHRVGQVRDVKVVRLISEKTIEEGILQRAKEKLKLDKDIHDEGDNEENDTASVAMLLRDALGLNKPNKS